MFVIIIRVIPISVILWVLIIVRPIMESRIHHYQPLEFIDKVSQYFPYSFLTPGLSFQIGLYHSKMGKSTG